MGAGINRNSDGLLLIAVLVQIAKLSLRGVQVNYQEDRNRKSNIIIYTTEDGLAKIETTFDEDTVWLSMDQMAELFQRDKSTISRHIKNVFIEGELQRDSVVANFATTAADGKIYQVDYYNLDVIISVGYRVKSKRGTQFRIWATNILKEYLRKGFAMDDERLKNLGGGGYFKELLERIRDIRASEKVFYRQVLEIYATSIDYDPKAEISIQFFKKVQNKIHYAIHGQTAAEVIYTIHAAGVDIGIYTQDFENEFISLTDIARYKSDDPTAVIQNWMRNRDVIEFLGLWERLHNPDFKPLEFEGFRKQAGANAFTMSPKKWIEATDAIGIVSKAGRYGGTYAHSDIAMSFATWISPEFQLYIMKDYRRLKTDENSRLSLNWNLNREISKLNYRIHTDAIKENLIPPELTLAQVAYTYANEADLLNVVLFGKTAKQWKDENPTLKGNMRDAATLNQLLVLANLESYILITVTKKQNLNNS